MKRYSMPLGRTLDYKHPHPDRTAQRAGVNWDSDVEFQVWPNRQSMARSIRMQERSPHNGLGGKWKALVPLTTGEGY